MSNRDPQTHVMLYLRANADVPFSVETTTARKGRKWFDLAYPNDTLELRYTEDNALFGKAQVTSRELLTYDQILKRSAENHAGDGVAAALEAAYGKSEPGDEFSMIGFIRSTDV
jgi:uncharacterized protein YqfB (UPF0267 family)